MLVSLLFMVRIDHAKFAALAFGGQVAVVLRAAGIAAAVVAVGGDCAGAAPAQARVIAVTPRSRTGALDIVFLSFSEVCMSPCRHIRAWRTPIGGISVLRAVAD
jgi:hypothetical protein